MREKVQKRLVFMMLILVAFVTMPLAGFADKNPPVSNRENSSFPLIGTNYRDHGLVNTNGTSVTTKNYSFITEKWQDNSTRTMCGPDFGDYGVIIDNYLFYIEDNSNGVFIVKDRTSGVKKKLDITIPDLATVRKSYVYTVLRGFKDNDDKPYYTLLVYQQKFGGIKWYEFQPDSAFFNAEETIKAKEINSWKPNFTQQMPVGDYKFVSLIRVPSLLPDSNAKDFCNNDFALAILYHNKLSSQEVFYVPLQFNGYTPLDGNITDRSISYRPYVEYKEHISHWSYLYKGYLSNLTAISGTTYIDNDGTYCLQVSFNCWGTLKADSIHSADFAAMKMQYFSINCHGSKNSGKYYSVTKGGNKEHRLVTMGNTHLESHYAVASTWAEAAGDKKAKQYFGFVSPYNREDAVFYKRALYSDANYDWSEDTLKKYGIENDETTFPQPDKKTGDGMIVQGMVLSVPPHPELYKNILKSSIKIKNSISCKEFHGVESSLGSTKAVEANACTPVISIAASASASWTRNESSTDWTTFSSGTDTTLANYEENLIFCIMPDWKAKCAVLKGNDNKNVRYANYEENPFAYVTIAAVMGKEADIHVFPGSTENPGESIRGDELALTAGMQPYKAAKFDEDDSKKLYDDYIRMCKNLENLKDKGDIEEIVTAGLINSDLKESKTWFDIKHGKEQSYSTTDSMSTKLTVKFGKTSNLSNETRASITKSYGTGFSKEEGCEFLYNGGDTRDVGNPHKVKPIVYKIPVSKLRAKYKNRTDKVDLKFIPDYMWNKSMDYWLIAYKIDSKVVTNL